MFGRLAGYEDVNDAERLARDPAMCAIVGRDEFDRAAASSSQMGRFETGWLATDANLAALTDLSGTWIDRVHARKARTRSAGRVYPATTFRHNAVRLQLHALAYDLANFLRILALPERVEHWSLTTLREKLVKIGARIVLHGRYVVFQLAEVAVPRALFAEILRRIERLRPRSPPFSA